MVPVKFFSRDCMQLMHGTSTRFAFSSKVGGSVLEDSWTMGLGNEQNKRPECDHKEPMNTDNPQTGLYK